MEGEELGVWKVSQIHSSYRQNSTQNRQIVWEDERARRKTKQPESRGGTWPCVPDSTPMPTSPRAVVDTMGRPWWWLSRVFLPLPERCVVYLFLFACFACVGLFWDSFAIFFDLLGPQKHLLILWFRLVNLNSVKTLKTSKTTHDRRNRGINHIIIHFNPLKWLLNT